MRMFSHLPVRDHNTRTHRVTFCGLTQISLHLVNTIVGSLEVGLRAKIDQICARTSLPFWGSGCSRHPPHVSNNFETFGVRFEKVDEMSWMRRTTTATDFRSQRPVFHILSFSFPVFCPRRPVQEMLRVSVNLGSWNANTPPLPTHFILGTG